MHMGILSEYMSIHTCMPFTYVVLAAEALKARSWGVGAENQSQALEEQPVLLPAAPFHQPFIVYFMQELKSMLDLEKALLTENPF